MLLFRYFFIFVLFCNFFFHVFSLFLNFIIYFYTFLEIIMIRKSKFSNIYLRFSYFYCICALRFQRIQKFQKKLLTPPNTTSSTSQKVSIFYILFMDWIVIFLSAINVSYQLVNHCVVKYINRFFSPVKFMLFLFL